MKQITAYGVRIHAVSMKPVQDMIRIYRQAVRQNGERRQLVR